LKAAKVEVSVFKEGIVHVLVIAEVIDKVIAQVGAAVVSSLSGIIVVTGWNGTSAATRSNLSKTWGMSVVVSRNG
jgi:deoxycytidylate deaminase